GASQRPIVFVAPGIFAHYKNLDCLLTLAAVIDAAQEMIVPAELVGIGIALGRGSEIEFAGLAVEGAVIPGSDHEALARHARFQPDIIAHDAALKNIVPAADEISRHFDVLVM